jgi:hypothetical protein
MRIWNYVAKHTNDAPERQIRLLLTEAKKYLSTRSIKGLILITTVQYWHTHAHPADYFRYTKQGLEHLLSEADFEIIRIWSIWGPYLLLYHVIELNMPEFLRKPFLITCPVFNFLDRFFFGHGNMGLSSDSVGWATIARKV